MGGSIYKWDLIRGGKEKVYKDENCAFGGIARSMTLIDAIIQFSAYVE
jgi:hypothetical protein